MLKDTLMPENRRSLVASLSGSRSWGLAFSSSHIIAIFFLQIFLGGSSKYTCFHNSDFSFEDSHFLSYSISRKDAKARANTEVHSSKKKTATVDENNFIKATIHSTSWGSLLFIQLNLFVEPLPQYSEQKSRQYRGDGDGLEVYRLLICGLFQNKDHPWGGKVGEQLPTPEDDVD